MGILVNESQIGGGGISNTSHNIGDIFYTTRTDNSLNGAVECNGSQYNFSDFDSNLQTLFDEGKLPYITIDEFDAMVTNQGGCDSFGYKTSNMVQIYPIGNDTEPAQMYIELTDQQFESFYTTLSQYNNGDILPYRLYDIGTKKLLEGYYIKCMGTSLFQAYDNNNERFGHFGDEPYFIPDRINGELVYYETIPDPDKSHASITTYFKVPKKVGRVLIRSQKPTADNDYTWYNLYSDGWVEQGGKFAAMNTRSLVISLPVPMADSVYSIIGTGNEYGNTSGHFAPISATTTSFTADVGTDNGNGGWWQVSGYANSAEYTKDKWNYQNVQVERPMIQLFNSTTDTAVATCNQVLSDISTLNQGDYVVYWDSYELSDHSHAYTGITLDEHQWYRIYKSGWVEQGGEFIGDTINSPIVLPLSMLSSHYQVVVHLVENGPYSSDNGPAVINSCFTVSGAINDRSTNQFVLSYPTSETGRTYMWQVSGFSFLA